MVTEEQLRETAADLLHILWRGVPGDYKRRYRMNIWQQFEDQVRSAAYTASLARFANALCRKLQIAAGRNAEDRRRLEAILNGGNDRDLLKLLREQTTLIVLMVRLRQEEARERAKYVSEDEEEQKLIEAWKEATRDGELPL